jgi:hypothetical protein
MAEFRGRLGTIIGEEGTRPRMYRVRLREPVEVPGVGMVEDDLWQGAALKAIRRRNGKDKQASLVGYAMAASLHRAFCPRCGKSYCPSSTGEAAMTLQQYHDELFLMVNLYPRSTGLLMTDWAGRPEATGVSRAPAWSREPARECFPKGRDTPSPLGG